MVRGIEKFRDYFKEYQDQYVIIGGTACDLLFEDFGGAFRLTKDIDMVLIVEALTLEFGAVFWEFIKAGKYQNRQKSNGVPQYYRFDKPEEPEYPAMIELFSRTSFIPDDSDAHCTPIHIDDDISSLSAILLDSDYYQLLQQGKSAVSDIIVLSAEYLILFKAKAWLDLSEKIIENPGIGRRNVKKHMDDILQLTTMLSGNEAPVLTEVVKADIEQYLSILREKSEELKAPETSGLNVVQLIEVLEKIYLTS